MVRYFYNIENAYKFLKKHINGANELNFNDTLYFGFLGCYCVRDFMPGRFEIDKDNENFCNVLNYADLREIFKELLKRDRFIKVTTI